MHYLKKAFFVALGCISLALGTIGIALPILPTVPFYLLTAFCFANSSERLHTWFTHTTVYKKYIGSYFRRRGMTRKELSKMVDVSVVSDTQLLEVVITSTDAEFACRIAQAFVNVAPTEIVRITKAGGAV